MPQTHPQQGREAWIDVAKGIAILAVVVAHASWRAHDAGIDITPWLQVEAALQPLRMPLFFLVSGLFASRALTSGRAQFAKAKIVRFVYLYVVWSCIIIGWDAALRIVQTALSTDALAAQAWDLVIIDGTLWYLPALALFFALARTLRRLAVPAQVLVAGAASLLFGSGLVSTGSWGVDHMGQYFIYFLVGCLFSRQVRSAAGRSRMQKLMVAVPAYACAMVVVGLWDLTWAIVLLPALALPAGVLLSAEAAKHSWLRWLSWMGARTLPIYVLHVPVLTTTSLLLLRVPDDQPAGLGVLLPLLLTAATVLVALVLWVTLRQVPGLFELPAVRRASARTAVPDQRAEPRGMTPAVHSDEVAPRDAERAQLREGPA